MWPLVLEWAASDDREREQLVARAPATALALLVDAVQPVLGPINACLDATGDAEHAVPYGDLAQAASEAAMELERRGIGSG